MQSLLIHKNKFSDNLSVVNSSEMYWTNDALAKGLVPLMYYLLVTLFVDVTRKRNFKLLDDIEMRYS